MDDVPTFLTRMELKKFCGFDDFTITFGPLTCLVGPNNGGKSTILKAIRFAFDAIDLSLPTYESQLNEYEKRYNDHEEKANQDEETLKNAIEAEQSQFLIQTAGLSPDARKRKETERLQNEEQRRKQVKQAFQQRAKSLETSAPKWTCPLDAVAKRQNIEEITNLFYRKNLRDFPTLTLCLKQGETNFSLKLRLRSEGKIIEIECVDAGTTIESIEMVRKELLQKIRSSKLQVVPTLGSLLPSENDLAWPQVQQVLDQGRPTDVWRNRIRWLNEGKNPEEYQRVIDRIREYVGDIQLSPPSRTKESTPKTSLTYREGGLQFDLSVAGSGVQMLLAVAAWTELSDANVLLIDEPDAHLHSHIQRQLANFFEESVSDGKQIIIASHAPDLIEELPTDTLVWIDRKEHTGLVCDDIEQTLVDLGVVSNRLALGFLKSTCLLYFEGKPDVHVLTDLLKKAGKDDLIARSKVMRLGGCGDAEHLPAFARLLSAHFHKDVAIVLIKDTDYAVPGSKFNGPVLVTSLPCKELENLLLLQPQTIHSAVKEAVKKRNRRVGSHSSPPDLSAIEAEIDRITASKEVTEVAKCNYELRDQTDTMHLSQSETSAGTFDAKWADAKFRRRAAPGKKVLKMLRQWLQSQHQVSLSSLRLPFSFYELDEPIKHLFDEIEKHVKDALESKPAADK
ncbi:MAG: AAA family ATPase [Kiritimatiellaeota bacterium]|nr:AAA family ATPase [Kiritimatiellota bacterium]